MFKSLDFALTIKTAAIAALAFAVPVFFYIRDTRYAESWLLYLGSFLFFVVIGIHTLFFNHGIKGNTNTMATIFESEIVTIMGIVIAVVLSLILLSIMVPGYLFGHAGRIAPDSPANTIHDKTNGLSFRILAGAVLINFAFGSFAATMFSFTIKQGNERDSKSDPKENEKFYSHR
jgi:hypothetical protein